MIDPKEIELAMSAHGAWKTRLKNAITSGKLDAPINVIESDNQCVFGKWLYGPTLTASEKTTATYAEIKRLHAEFHKCAARVAELAAEGKKAEAMGILEGNGLYSTVSGKLMLALMQWKQAIGQPVAR